MFAIGDAADAFGAIQAGHTSYNQAEIAAANILRLIEFDEKEGNANESGKLQHYKPGLPIIKVSLGLVSDGLVIRSTRVDYRDLFLGLLKFYDRVRSQWLRRADLFGERIRQNLRTFTQT